MAFVREGKEFPEYEEAWSGRGCPQRMVGPCGCRIGSAVGEHNMRIVPTIGVAQRRQKEKEKLEKSSRTQRVEAREIIFWSELELFAPSRRRCK